MGNVVGTARELSVQGGSVVKNSDLSLQDNHATVQMELNEIGKIVNDQLKWLENQYPYVVIHNSIVMPNHIHVIIEIDSTNIVRTGRDLSLQKIKSLSELMGAFKTTSSKLIHLAGHKDFKWQRSFHDHVISDEKSYLKISNYIDTNPQKWEEDKFYNK